MTGDKEGLRCPAGSSPCTSQHNKRSCWAAARDSVKRRTNYARNRWATIGRIVKGSPSIVVWPLLVLALVLGVGIWGVTHVAQADATASKNQAASMARDTLAWYKSSIYECLAPAHALAVTVIHDPLYEEVITLFESSAELLTGLAPHNAMISLQLAPNGVTRLVHPNKPGPFANIGEDLFADPQELPLLLRAVRQQDLYLVGPYYTPYGDFPPGDFIVRVRIPVFISNWTQDMAFGAPDPVSRLCGHICHNASEDVHFWGFASAYISVGRLFASSESRIRALDTDWRWELLLRTPEGLASLLTGSKGGPKHEPVEAEVNMPGGQQLVLRTTELDGKWMPPWYGALVAGVVILGVSISLLVFAVLVSRREHQLLLEALLPKSMIKEMQKEDPACIGPRIIRADTPADLLLSMMSQLLNGHQPDVRDILFVRTAITQNMDIYRPHNLTGHIKAANMDEEVTRALMRQLGGQVTYSSSELSDNPRGDEPGSSADPGTPGEQPAHKGAASQASRGCDTLQGALALLLTPAGWHEVDSNDAASDAALPCSGTEAAVTHSRRQSLQGNPQLHTGSAFAVRREGSGSWCSNDANVHVQPLVATQSRLGAHADLSGHHAGAGAEGSTHGSERELIPAGSTGANVELGSSANAVGSEEAVAGAGEAPGGAKHRRPPRRTPSLLTAVTSAVGRVRRKSQLQAQPSPLGGGEEGVGVGVLSVDGMLLVERASSRGAAAGAMGRQPTGVAAVVGAAAIARKQALLPPPAAVVEEVERLLARADEWQFDTWKLAEATQGHPLSALGFYLMQRQGIIARFKLKPLMVARLLRHIEAGYPDNPYHSATHAADVLQTLHVLVHGAQLHVHYLDGLGLFAAYFAAIIHDYGHPGLTNDFLIATADPLAVRYNDRSPLENHHSAAAFSVLRRPELDIMAGLSNSERASFRKQVIEMVLATDMKQHFAILGHFNTMHRLAGFQHRAAAGGSGQATPLHQQSVHSDLPHTVVMVSPELAAEIAPKPLDDTERLLTLQLALKCADIGHLGEKPEVHKRWLAALEEEFFSQGDQEKELGLPISPLFDRTKQGVSKSQVGFYDFVALPLLHAFSSAFNGAQPLMASFVINYNHWRVVDGQQPMAMPLAAKLPGPRQSVPEGTEV